MTRALGVILLGLVLGLLGFLIADTMKTDPILMPPIPTIDPPNRAHRLATLDGFAVYEVVRDGGIRELVVSPLCGKAQWGDALSECRP